MTREADAALTKAAIKESGPISRFRLHLALWEEFGCNWSGRRLTRAIDRLKREAHIVEYNEGGLPKYELAYRHTRR
jgi:hypothetical protein